MDGLDWSEDREKGGLRFCEGIDVVLGGCGLLVLQPG